ncbi:uncharacterized protein LOC144727404 isoform X1 [Lampetra planeri]
MGAGSSNPRTRVRRIAVSQLPPAAATGDPATTPKTGPFERTRVPFSPGHAATAVGVRPTGVSAAWGPPGVPAGDPRAELPRVRAPRGMEETTRHAGPRTLPSLPRLLPRSFGAANAVVAIAPDGETSTKACSSSIIHAHPPRLVQRLQEEPLPSAPSSTPHEAPSRQGQRGPVSNLGGLVTRVPDEPEVTGVRLHGVPIRELQSSDDSELDSWTSKHDAMRRATTMTSRRRRRKRMRTRRYGQGEGTEQRGAGRGLVRTHAEEIPMIDAFFDQPLPALT